MTVAGGSSLRARLPAETLAIAQRAMPELGITRVADITRMDRLGLPVFASIRPRGRALCVNAGKGLNPIDARVGALMEAIEFAVAEPSNSAWQGHSWRLQDLESEWSTDLRLGHLAPRIGPRPAADTPVEAVLCEDIAGGRAMWLPAELIFMPYGDELTPLLCGWSSNGLASGNTVEEATLHALFEVLERDAMAMGTVRDDSLWLPQGEWPEPFGSMAECWKDLGIRVSARLVPNVLGLPCFRALVHEGEGAIIGLAEGSGLHFDAGIALSRALCEAAQARLSHIHGGRDDITQFYTARTGETATPPPTHESLAYREAFDTTRATTWAAIPSLPCHGRPQQALLEDLIARLRQAGFTRVLRHRFDRELGGLHVVKVVVPGCEMIDRRLERVGPRLYQRIKAIRA